MTDQSAEQERPDLRPRHCTTEGCDCEHFVWNGSPDALKSDPPTTCKCGHWVAHHSFIERTSPPDSASGGGVS